MSALMSVDTTKSLARLREDVPRACADHKFGVLNVHDLQGKLREKGVEFARGTLVFDVCNPHQAKKVLDAHAEVATALPCRIAAFEIEGGARTRLATIRPTELIGLFGAAALEPVAREVEATLEAILREAAG